MQLPELNNLFSLSLTTLILFVIISGRYFVVAGLFYFIFHKWFKTKWFSRKINIKDYKPGQFKSEVLWSMLTGFIFSIAGAFTLWLWQKGYTKIYIDPLQYGWLYLPISLLILMFVHETYYYWLHRWMHKPVIFKIVHKVHHNSNITSPFTAFSFHPLEGILQAVFLPVMLVLLPLHYSVILLQLSIMTISSVVNHLDIEIYPGVYEKNIFARWIIGATHHSLHHKQFRYNFGLYFTFWDKIKHTESPEFKRQFNNLKETEPILLETPV